MTFSDPLDFTARNGRAAPPQPPVGEVIESTTTDFVAQACELDGAPPFGSFVQVIGDDGFTVLGVVAQVETAGIDPLARPIMRGYGDVRDLRIYQENPDLPQVLRTTFRVLMVGYAEGASLRQLLPPRPARLHYSVRLAPASLVRAFTDAGLGYLDGLLAAADVPVDELVAANLRLVARERGDGERFLHAAGRELARLLRADYARLAAILRRIVAQGA